ncbi:hypothetical protein OPT61_g1983 [Boeremia exigua]|uniref:Uncharacterized protein n=1 Tax=Boeremia exigua TaxID=749465 RepID=A0ACC2IND6_9PLEO|nr:hypothetical protein OPT61_g1983 [Boeremia exigua]
MKSHRRLNREQAAMLVARIERLTEQNRQLEIQIARLFSIAHPISPNTNNTAAVSTNALRLPAVIETMIAEQVKFRQKGTLRSCAWPNCGRPVYDHVCMKAGHLAWCQTHHRPILGTLSTACPVDLSERIDCVPVHWEQRQDWPKIVARALQYGDIGHKGVHPALLERMLSGADVSHSHSHTAPIAKHFSHGFAHNNGTLPRQQRY